MSVSSERATTDIPAGVREHDVLLAAIRVDDERDRLLRERLRGQPDWPRLIFLAGRHGVLPLLHRALQNAGGLAPAPVMSDLRAAWLANVHRNLRRTCRLLQILEQLGRHGIDAMPIKGPALAIDVYGDVSLRQFADLDILIDGDHLDAACERLPALGLEPSVSLNAKRRRWLRRTARELTFSDGRDVVEIQWALAERFLLPARYDEELRRPTRTLDVLGTTVRAMSEEAVLTFMCLHGAKHRWERLGWAADVAHFVAAHPALDWRAVWDAGCRRGHARILALGLGLAHDLCGVVLPGWIDSQLRADRAATRLAREAASRLVGAVPSSGDPGAWAFFGRSRERWRDRARDAFALTVSPKPGDWLGLDLPDTLYPVYYALRPVRMLVKVGRRAIPYPTSQDSVPEEAISCLCTQ